MKFRLSPVIAMIGTLVLSVASLGAAPETDVSDVRVSISGGAITFLKPRVFPQTSPQSTKAPVMGAANTNPVPARPDISTRFFHAEDNTLPLWTFNIKGSRDGNHHLGTIVGHSPFGIPGTDKIPTFIVPLVIRTHRVATSVDPNTLVMTTAAGDTTTDPTVADNTCLVAPNNVPETLVRQSPIITPTKFVFGGNDLGTTQYIDAFQRASFFKALGSHFNEYHVLLDPVRTAEPIVIDVPANEGLAITNPQFFSAFGITFCAPLQLVDINWFDSYVTGTVIPGLQEQGIEASALPLFLSYEAVWPVADVTNLNNCCALGYHSATGVPFVTQTYGVAEFDRSQFFVGPPGGLDSSVLSHEVGEWANDPFGSNATAPWGNTGQVAGCQANLEVGDPLSGTDLPPVTMPNGFTYHLQELAFFSWFYGAPSVGINGWFSNNGTFLTDAGHVCP
jgi:hypothetical protein